MTIKLVPSIKRISYNIFRNITTNRSTRRTIEKFTKKIGIVYFGSVSQHDDEHRIIRGFSVSSTHLDNHYCVGSVDGYDIAIVDRNDVILKADNSVAYNNLLIMAFDLKTKQDLPHIFINANNHNKVSYDLLFTTYPMLFKLNFGTFEEPNHEFTSRFTTYASPDDSIEVEKLLPTTATRVLSAHLWPFSVEIHDGILYVYSDSNKISTHTLDTILTVSLWLAHYIDSQIERI